MIIAANIVIKNPLRYEPERIFIVLIPFLAITLCLLLFGSSFFSSRGFFGRSLFGRCFGSGFCSSFSSFLFSQCFCFFFVYLLFSFQTCFCFSFLSFVFLSLQSSQTALFVVLPGFELSISFSFAECAFRYTAQQVLLHVNTFAREDVTNCVSRLCTLQHPVKCAVELQIYCGRIGVRIVSTNLLNKFTITWCSYVCNNDRVESVAFTSMSLQSDFCCHLIKMFLVNDLNYATIS